MILDLGIFGLVEDGYYHHLPYIGELMFKLGLLRFPYPSLLELFTSNFLGIGHEPISFIRIESNTH